VVRAHDAAERVTIQSVSSQTWSAAILHSVLVYQRHSHRRHRNQYTVAGSSADEDNSQRESGHNFSFLSISVAKANRRRFADDYVR